MKAPLFNGAKRLVTGEACCVAHIMGSVVQRSCLNVASDYDDAEAYKRGKCNCQHVCFCKALSLNGDFGFVFHVFVSFTATPDSMG